jgi:hypothetical protein
VSVVHDPDEAMRHHLTVVRGYLGLLLEEPGGQLGDEHWGWLERAYGSAVDALQLHADVRGPAVPPV